MRIENILNIMLKEFGMEKEGDFIIASNLQQAAIKLHDKIKLDMVENQNNEYLSDSFVKMTAKDYDVSFDVARNIIKKYPNNFYQELENYISRDNCN